MARWEAARFDEIEELDDGREPFRPTRHHFGISSFGVNTWTARAVGDRIINEHTEDDSEGHEELYLVLEGRARFELDGESVDAPAGTLVFAEPGVKRTAFADEAPTTLVAIGGRPGKAYEVMGFEAWVPFAPLYNAGEYAEAADRGGPVADAHPEHPGLLYNVACCEALAGRSTDAIRHLTTALERSPQLAELAKTDSDLDSLRDEAEFEQLLAR